SPALTPPAQPRLSRPSTATSLPPPRTTSRNSGHRPPTPSQTPAAATPLPTPPPPGPPAQRQGSTSPPASNRSPQREQAPQHPRARAWLQPVRSCPRTRPLTQQACRAGLPPTPQHRVSTCPGPTSAPQAGTRAPGEHSPPDPHSRPPVLTGHTAKPHSRAVAAPHTALARTTLCATPRGSVGQREPASAQATATRATEPTAPPGRGGSHGRPSSAPSYQPRTRRISATVRRVVGCMALARRALRTQLQTRACTAPATATRARQRHRPNRLPRRTTNVAAASTAAWHPAHGEAPTPGDK